MGSVLRFSRILVAIVIFALFICLFADFGMAVPAVAAWLARVQFLPAAMAFAVTIFIVWLIVTLIFGRIYCSTFCPLGIFQDICSRLPRLGSVRPSWFYHYSRPMTCLRRIMLFFMVLSIILGISAITSLLDPYSIFGRFGFYVLKPLWAFVLNLWTGIDSAPQIRLAVASMLGIVLAVVMILVIGAIAFLNGRTYCNSICPVGTTLGFISHYSIFRIDIDTDRCIQCRKCEHRCKSSCIDLTSHVVDMSRCVVCFDCLSDCPNDAISYTYNRHQLSIPLMQRVKNTVVGPAAGIGDGKVETATSERVDVTPNDRTRKLLDRRRFLSMCALVAASPAVIEGAKITSAVERSTLSPLHRNLLPVTPPGVRTRREFLERCTACGLCVDRCPQKVLQVSVSEYGLLRALHPVMNYDASWCVYECTICSNLCPTEALHPLTVKEKQRSRSGLAYADRSGCISFTQGVNCGACSRRCPTGAITMVTSDEGKGPYPVVDSEKCIGCGACQYVCPASPKAIVVGGIA
ncbi:MAG: 4Fe-4S dicluster domain-containing protein [Bacteroides sp.]|nr:4Fe-4S dicluster domain-containing protein [Bacteroides sp.]